MVFASDLDMTLVFSDKFLPYSKKDLKVAEIKRDGRQAYMSKEVFNNLKDMIDNGLVFIPTTARTYDRYKNIHLLHELNLKYEITGNGKDIWVNGEKDAEWQSLIENKLKNEKISLSEITEIVNNFISTLNNKEFKIYQFDDYLSIFSFSKKDFFTREESERLQELLKDTGWSGYCCNRKLYITVDYINKKSALDYMKEKYFKKDEFIVAGDSLSDLDMLMWSDYAIVPKHGDINLVIQREDLKVTETEGISSSKDIINKIKEIQKEV